MNEKWFVLFTVNGKMRNTVIEVYFTDSPRVSWFSFVEQVKVQEMIHEDEELIIMNFIQVDKVK